MSKVFPLFLTFFCLFFSTLGFRKFHSSILPEQIHLSFGNKLTDIVVTWVTLKKAHLPTVKYGIYDFESEATGTQNIFIDGGKERRRFYINKVTLKDLKEDTKYQYMCGSSAGWSKPFHFKTLKLGSDWSPKLAVFGDMGASNPVALKSIIKEGQQGYFNAILHVGDFAYDLDKENGYIGDKFMNLIEPVAAIVPYMTAVGNHESKYNFKHYRKRFSMPGKTEGMQYTFTMGPAQFIVFSSEVYYNNNTNPRNQYLWLEKELKKANKPENRRKRPWIITVAHRPMYCSSTDDDDCTHERDKMLVDLEKLFYDYAVDIELYAHEHNYERTWPLFNYTVFNGTDAPYIDPQAPVHIISGSAGCIEGKDNFNQTRPFWSAKRLLNYGFGRMKIFNATHLFFEQVITEKHKQTGDWFWIVKNQHGQYPLGGIDLNKLYKEEVKEEDSLKGYSPDFFVEQILI